MTRRAKMRMHHPLSDQFHDLNRPTEVRHPTDTEILRAAGVPEKPGEIRYKPEETIGNLSYGPPDAQGMKDRIAQLELECVELDRTNEEERKAYEERITTLEKELTHAEGQVHATKNHRLQTIAAPIMAELMGSMYRGDGIVTQELDSVARIAIQAAQCLLTELEALETENPNA